VTCCRRLSWIFTENIAKPFFEQTRYCPSTKHLMLMPISGYRFHFAVKERCVVVVYLFLCSRHTHFHDVIVCAHVFGFRRWQDACKCCHHEASQTIRVICKLSDTAIQISIKWCLWNERWSCLLATVEIWTCHPLTQVLIQICSISALYMYKTRLPPKFRHTKSPTLTGVPLLGTAPWQPVKTSPPHINYHVKCRSSMTKC